MYTSNDDLVSFSAPNGWTLTPHELTCFAFRFGKNDQSHFVLTATEKGPEPNAINEYIKVLLDEAVRVNADSLQLTNYATYENAYRKSYYISFSDGKKMEATNYYSWITENDKYIMDFTMKSIEEAETIGGGHLFNVVMASMEMGGESVIGSEASLEIVEVGVD